MAYRSKVEEQSATTFLKQFNRIKEGIKLVPYIEWDEEEECFIINGHHLFFDPNEGWRCDCADRIYTNWFCKHMIALIYYMGGLPDKK